MRTDLNGAKRNWAKFVDEYEKWKEGMAPHVTRFLTSYKNPRDIHHAYVNLFVESRRLSPYLSGHIGCVAVPLFIIAIIL